MSTRYGHPKLRLRLFNDNGMTEQLRKNLYWVIWAVTIGMLGFVVTTGAVWSGFQREVLGANDFQLGLISAIPVSTCVLQVFISYYMEKKRNRRFLFLFLGIIGRSFWILIALVPYLFPNFPVDLRIWLVIVFVVIISSGNSGVNLAFGSLMGDLVPINIRGSFFSVRQMISLTSGVITGLIMSAMIDRVGLVGYSIALGIAGVSMVLDIACYFFVEWPEMESAELPSLPSLLKEVFRNKTFLRVVTFYSLWLFSVNIAGPFWNIHMLEYLQMSYTQITLYSQIASGIATILIISRWGRLIDRYGNKPVLTMAAMFIVISPIPWLFATHDTAYFVIISNVISGATWPVIDICQQNLYLSQSPKLHRSMYIAVFFACINLFGIALANAVGGYLMQTPFAYLTASHPVVLGLTMTKMHWMIIASILCRVTVLIVFLPRIHEEGAQTFSHTVKCVVHDTSDRTHRHAAAVRATFQRKRLRKILAKGTDQPDNRKSN
ncbi:MAG TPA: MFS transporter [Candidatus Limiplasma sp.]|nr:MFS transporter [Candidatus Limiplasma sp.]